MKSSKTLNGQPKTRSHVAISAHFQTGAGTHGGSKRATSRRQRRDRSFRDPRNW